MRKIKAVFQIRQSTNPCKCWSDIFYKYHFKEKGHQPGKMLNAPSLLLLSDFIVQNS